MHRKVGGVKKSKFLGKLDYNWGVYCWCTFFSSQKRWEVVKRVNFSRKVDYDWKIYS